MGSILDSIEDFGKNVVCVCVCVYIYIYIYIYFIIALLG